MPVTKANLVSLVNQELENYTRKGSGEATADGTLKAFLVAPHGYQIIENANFLVYLDDVATSAFTMDYTSGVCTMTSTPTAAVVVSFLYDYIYWPDALVVQAINAGIVALFPHFYVQTLDSTITTDGETYEFTLPAGTAYVGSVSYREAVTDPWVRYQRNRRYEVIQDGTSQIIRFYEAPDTGTLRVHSIARPAEMTVEDSSTVAVNDITVANPSIVGTSAVHGLTTGDLVYFTLVGTTPEINLTYQVVTVTDTTHFSVPVNVATVTDEAGFMVFTDSLETTCGLPARAQHPIVSYACYYLLTQKTAPRIRADVAVVTQGRGNLSPRQMTDAANSFYLRHQMQVATSKQSPWVQR